MQNRKTKKRHRTGKKIYGQPAHYWPEKMLPFALSAACTQVVLENSEAAKRIYDEAAEAWARGDCQAVLNETKIPFSSCLIAMEAVESNKISDWVDPFEDTYTVYKDSKDFAYLIDRINEFIKVGFNGETEQLKVMPSREHWLFYTVFVRTLVDFAASKPDFEKNRIVEFAGLFFDPATFLDGTPNNRVHRFRTKRYRSHGWLLKNDSRIMRIAWHWYQCRVVYSGPTEFCRSGDFTSEETPDPNEIDREIAGCDEAVGYPRGNWGKPSD
ncbi:hypothetical protein ES708_11454 [subsurface metagenome]